MFPYPDSDYDRGSSFLHVGGTRNYTSLHLWACRLLTGRDVHIPDLDLPPAQGIYHRTKGVRMRGREFLDSVDTSRPVIGIMMSQRTAMTEETEAVDALIDALVSRGASVIPVFLKSTRGGLDGSIGTEACIKRYFMKGRKPVVDAVVVCTGFSQRILGSGEDGRNPFGILGVPVIQAPSVYRPVAEWRMDNLGLGPMEMSVNVVQTEYDGQILSAPLGFITGRGNGRECAFVPDRVSMIADSTLAWSRLRRKPKGEARIAIVLNPFSGESSEPARGLDSVESLRLILKAMGRSGYEIDSIPGDRREMWRLMCRTSCHSDPGEGYVMPDDVSPDCYRMWLGEVPRGIRERMEADFGTVEGLMPIHIPGFIDGNVFIGLEPDPSIGSHHVFSHDYLAFYRWIERTFRADAIVHLGDRSKLDGLPGKETGLTSTCLPDIILGPMVRICPFAVDDIRNGLVAKRRTHSVLIGHLTPPEERMGTSMGMDELEARLQDIMMGEGSGSMNDVRSMIDSLNLWREVGLDPGCSDGDIRGIAPRIYDYITELRNESVTDGLHVFGSGLRGTRLRKAVMESLRFSNGNIPSLPSVLAGNRGLDLEWMMREPSGITEGHLNAELLESVENESQRIVDSMAERGFRADGCMELFPDDPQIGKIAKFVCSSLVPSLKGCSGEMSSLMTALAGGFVEPGPSGFPYRGGAHILPTGRNFHGSDPRRIPDEAGWRRGSEM
ncbi:MAG: cobaltochelatase subunit CobN, partial [Candidatus Methanomethylophilaceae archaeon]